MARSVHLHTGQGCGAQGGQVGQGEVQRAVVVDVGEEGVFGEVEGEVGDDADDGGGDAVRAVDSRW
ncbi:hypothetical protein ACFRJ1_05290 [Streptomyces sp. NPDC056773]|uniref:hypothetical protein n=1 Tax=unclassified Streptomyces TaxID=2593676 RepID=UPI0036B38161